MSNDDSTTRGITGMLIPMRKMLRYASSGISLLLLVVVGTLFRQNIEVFASENGFDVLFREGWLMVTQQGYAFWVLLLFVFVSGATAAMWLDHFLRPQNPFKGTKKKIEKRIVGKHFQNERVPVDGIAYEGCTFTNVTLVYNGGAISLSHNDISGVNIATDVPEIERHVRMLLEFKFIQVPATGPDGPLEFTGVDAGDTPTDGQILPQ